MLFSCLWLLIVNYRYLNRLSDSYSDSFRRKWSLPNFGIWEISETGSGNIPLDLTNGLLKKGPSIFLGGGQG